MAMTKTAWRLRGTDLELCNCDPGCGCNFRGFPSSPEGNCEAFVVAAIEEGNFGDIDLSGAKVAWALWWPGPIHGGHGKGHAYVDCQTDEQYEKLAEIWRGEHGYTFFEIFNSTFEEPNVVERATVNLELNGKSSSFSVEGVAEARMTPLTNPVTGEENDVRVVKPGGFIWTDGEIVQGELLKVDLPEMSFEHTGRHGVIGAFDWGSG